jgi:phosphoserine phosphatase RsbU/P
MQSALESGSPSVRPWWKRMPPSGVAGAFFWVALGFALIWTLRQVPGTHSRLLGPVQFLVGLVLIVLAFPLAWKLIRKHLLWSLRSKLIVTYLLIGLAPVVLFVILAGYSAYLAVGQFSIHLAETRMRRELDEMGMNNAQQANRLARMERMIHARAEGTMGPPPQRPRPQNIPGREGPPGVRPAPPPQEPKLTAQQQVAESLAQVVPLAEALPDPLRARLHPHTSVLLNGAPLPPPPDALAVAAPQHPGPQATPLGLPAWAADLQGKEFRYLVLDDGDLYLVVIDQRHVEGVGVLSVVTSLPVDAALMDVVAEGLGRVRISGVKSGARTGGNATPAAGRIPANGFHVIPVYGGVEPPPVAFYDIPVSFLSTLGTVDWETSQPARIPANIDVHSRPSLLYHQLFGSSLGGIFTNFHRGVLITLCVVFALIEALALWMAWRLFRALTASVHELYEATRRVDRGDFVQRIPAAVIGEQDQVGELALSFNRMTGSLERLLVEQKEKERLQGELLIAQEVQANLFPHRAKDLPTLQIHGICRPARTVSGDYYDFLVFHHQNKDAQPGGNGTTKGSESGVGIVLGDISGKGISAALLMATLHSAVRAYRFASEDLVYSESSLAGLTVSREALPADSGKLFESPGRILSLLNRHLYRSTQPEKYATLFLAHYDAATAQITYSNAGHLPPLLLGLDGKIRRLDCGGTVVGLMDGMRYEEGRVQMHSGDILVAYSDGVTEPENDFGEFGEARLMEVVARYRDQPLHVISAQVMLALDTWIGDAEQPDDITLVLARQV